MLLSTVLGGGGKLMLGGGARSCRWQGRSRSRSGQGRARELVPVRGFAVVLWCWPLFSQTGVHLYASSFWGNRLHPVLLCCAAVRCYSMNYYHTTALVYCSPFMLWCYSMKYYLRKTFLKTASLMAHSSKAVAVLGGHSDGVR